MAGHQNRRRAQVTPIAMTALFFVIVVVLFFMLKAEKVEDEIADATQKKRLTAEMLDQLQRIVEEQVRMGVYEAANAVGQAGGFTAENIPEPNYHGLPVYFYKGSVTHVPTSEAMARMLRFEIAKRIENNLFSLEKKKQYRVSRVEIEGGHITLDEKDIDFGDNFITVKVEVPITLEYNDIEAEMRETVSVELPLRLFRLHKIADAFVHLYESKDDAYRVRMTEDTFSHPWYRKIEFLIDYIIDQDFRLPRPSTEEICKPFNLPDTTGTYHYGFCLPCSKPEVSIPFKSVTPDGKSIKGAFGDDVTVATTIFSSEAQTIEYQRIMLRYMVDSGLAAEMNPDNDEDVLRFMKGFSISFRSLIGGNDECYPQLNLTLNGERDNLIIRSLSQRSTGCFHSCPAGLCYKSYKANYTASFPVEVTVTDLLPTGKIIGSSTLIKPLQFRFVLYPYLELGDEARADVVLPSDYNQNFDLACTGKCLLSLKVHGPREGEVVVEPCNDKRERFNTSVVNIHDVPCGIRDVRIVPMGEDAARYAPLRTKVALPSWPIDVVLKEYHRIEGEVMANTTIYCENWGGLHCFSPTNEIILHEGVCAEGDRGSFERLGFVGGMPPSFVSVQLVPLNTSLEMLETHTDADGSYVFENVLEGTYLFLASPSRDFGGNVGYTVMPEADILEVTRDAVKDVVMTSVFSVNMTGRFIPVHQIRRC